MSSPPRLSPSVQAVSEIQENYFQLLRGQRSGRVGSSNVFLRPLSAAVDEVGRLTWKWPEHNKVQRFPLNLCFVLARLGEASDGEVRAFAARWGPLRINPQLKETASEWRDYARLAQSNFRWMIPRRQPEDWKRICEWLPPGAQIAEAGPLPRDIEMALTAAAVNLWYNRAHGHQILEVVGKRFQARIAGTTLLGALAAQIAYKLAVLDQPIICAGCPNAFTPKPPPSRGSRQYCPDCLRKQIPQRDAARDFRKRKRLGE